MKCLLLFFLSYGLLAYSNSENYFFEYKDVKDSLENHSALKWQSAAIITTSLLLYTNDKKIHEFITSEQDNKLLKDISDVVIHFGTGKTYFASGAISLGGYLLKDQKLFDAGILSIAALLVSGAKVTLFKGLIGRSRPRRNMGTYEFKPFFQHKNDNDQKSMVSGDSSNAWAVATVLSTLYNDKPFVGITLYTLAALVSINRVFVDAHWPTDVFLGSAVGYYSGKLVTSIFLKKLKDNKRFFFMPIITKSKKHNKLGLNLSYSF